MHRCKKTHVILVILITLLVGGCASTGRDKPPSEGEQITENKADKFERFNRGVFKFNDTVDKWLLKPVAKGYDRAVPSPVKAGVGNFFSNIGEVSNILNDGLQWKWKQASNDTGRLLVNSTIGVLGLFDVASKAGLPKSDGEDFGQTLHAWGVPRGSYVVLPFWGPTTIRGGAALPVNWAMSPMQYTNPAEARLAANALDIIHLRSELLKAEELVSGDRYLFIREAYLQRLEYLENDGVVVDDFGDDFGEDDEYGDGF